MGTSRTNAPRPALSVLGLLIVGLVLPGTGCNTGDNDRLISAQSFETAELEKGGMRELVNKIELLRAITPSVLADDVLLQQQANAVPLEKTSGSDLLVYESNKAALLSLDLCEECTRSSFLRGGVTMHWSQDGLASEFLDRQPPDIVVTEAQNPTISFDLPGSQVPGVRPIRLRGPTFRGWVLAAIGRRTIVGFKKVPGFREVPSELSGEQREMHPNFGAGNGLLMAVVLSDRDLSDRFGAGFGSIARMTELDDGKILLIFSPGSPVRGIRLLELEEVERTVDFDLATGNPREVTLPRGRLAPESEPVFVSDTAILAATGLSGTLLSDFQPVYLPPLDSDFCERGVLPPGGSVLVYEARNGNFLRVWEDPSPLPGEPRGRVRVAISRSALVNLLDKPPPYDVSEGILGTACDRAIIFERESSTLFSFAFRDLGVPLQGSLRVTAGSGNFLLRRDPGTTGGGNVIPGGEETVLRAADNNIRGSRLYFDQGRRELVAVHFDTGNVVVVVDPADFLRVTGRQLANFTWIEKLPEFSQARATGGGEVLRAFDTFSTSLLEIRVLYRPLPIIDRQR